MASVVSRSEAMTRDGHARLSDELARLQDVELPALVSSLRDARDDGSDLGENPGLAAAVQERDALERRIAELEDTLARAEIVDPADDGVAGLGQTLRIRMGDAAPVECRLVGPGERDAARRLISIGSPVGAALAGRRAGETVEVDTPGGRRRVEILAVG